MNRPSFLNRSLMVDLKIAENYYNSHLVYLNMYRIVINRVFFKENNVFFSYLHGALVVVVVVVVVVVGHPRIK